MSNTIDSTEVKPPQEEITQFYLLKTADKLSMPYPVYSSSVWDFLDSLESAGWVRENISEKTSIYTAPLESNIVLFMARAGAAS